MLTPDIVEPDDIMDMVILWLQRILIYTCVRKAKVVFIPKADWPSHIDLPTFIRFQNNGKNFEARDKV